MEKYLSDDELISAINHSSDPYIIVEGKSDVMIYRWILEDIDCAGLLEPRCGCNRVKSLYNRRSEIKNPKVVFICDRDTMVYTGIIPQGYEDIIYTEGYSIENDLYQGKFFETKLFKKEDKTVFSMLLDSFLIAYACELEKFRSSEEYNFALKPDAIIDKNDYSLKVSELSRFRSPTDTTVNYLKEKYDLLLRGHSLFALVRMVFERKGRKISYSLTQLYELSYCNKSDSICKMQNRIRQLIR